MLPAQKRRCSVCHASYSRGESFCSIDGGAIIADDGTDDELVGSTIDGRYLIARVLGRGGMGKVYEADHIGLGKKVAIKFVSAADADRDQRARFRQEARAASRIVHEHVVQIFDVGVDAQGREYIVMEHVEGRDLDAVLREGPLPPTRAITIALQILDGLQSCHAAGVIHRDIKPSNIRLTDGDFVKIMDFGIAKSMHGQVAQTDTGTGRAIGTPQFMAPEQILDGDVDHRADLYAVGGTLFAMLAGAPPFSSTSFTHRVEALTATAPMLDSLRSDLPPPLVAAVARALECDPANRFPHAVAFAAALEEGAAIAGARRDAATKGMPYPGARAREGVPASAPARRIWPFAIAAVVLAATTGIVVYLVTRPPQADATHRAVESGSNAIVPGDAAIAIVPGDAAIAVIADAAIALDLVDAAPKRIAKPTHATVTPPDAAVAAPTNKCDCIVKTGIRNTTNYACIRKIPAPRCECRNSSNTMLCPVVITVTDNTKERLPDGTRSGTMWCIDRDRTDCDPLNRDVVMPKSCWLRERVAVHGDPCRGYKSGMVEADTQLEGTYFCDLCDWAKTAPKYHGKTGDKCEGFEAAGGEHKTGELKCYD